MSHFELDESMRWQSVNAIGDFPPTYRIETVEGNVYWSTTEVFNIAFVGRGSSVAYYLETLGAPYLAPPKGAKVHGTAKAVRP